MRDLSCPFFSSFFFSSYSDLTVPSSYYIPFPLHSPPAPQLRSSSWCRECIVHSSGHVTSDRQPAAADLDAFGVHLAESDSSATFQITPRPRDLQYFQTKVVANLLPVLSRLLCVYTSPRFLNDPRRSLHIKAALRFETLQQGQQPLSRFSFYATSGDNSGPHETAL